MHFSIKTDLHSILKYFNCSVLRFSQQHNWGFLSPGVWHCAAVWVVPDTTKNTMFSFLKVESCTWCYRKKAVGFERSGTTHQKMQCHILEDLNPSPCLVPSSISDKFFLHDHTWSYACTSVTSQMHSGQPCCKLGHWCYAWDSNPEIQEMTVMHAPTSRYHWTSMLGVYYKHITLQQKNHDDSQFY